jgi:hypothetical protein
MIAKFNTPAPTGGGEAKGGNTLLYIGIAVVGGYLLYRYVVKPYLDKKKAESETAK